MAERGKGYHIIGLISMSLFLLLVWCVLYISMLVIVIPKNVHFLSFKYLEARDSSAPCSNLKTVLATLLWHRPFLQNTRGRHSLFFSTFLSKEILWNIAFIWLHVLCSLPRATYTQNQCISVYDQGGIPPIYPFHHVCFPIMD